jgi:hypothetical protein
MRPELSPSATSAHAAYDRGWAARGGLELGARDRSYPATLFRLLAQRESGYVPHDAARGAAGRSRSPHGAIKGRAMEPVDPSSAGESEYGAGHGGRPTDVVPAWMGSVRSSPVITLQAPHGGMGLDNRRHRRASPEQGQSGVLESRVRSPPAAPWARGGLGWRRLCSSRRGQSASRTRRIPTGKTPAVPKIP